MLTTKRFEIALVFLCLSFAVQDGFAPINADKVINSSGKIVKVNFVYKIGQKINHLLPKTWQKAAAATAVVAAVVGIPLGLWWFFGNKNSETPTSIKVPEIDQKPLITNVPDAQPDPTLNDDQKADENPPKPAEPEEAQKPPTDEEKALQQKFDEHGKEVEALAVEVQKTLDAAAKEAAKKAEEVALEEEIARKAQEAAAQKEEEARKVREAEAKEKKDAELEAAELAALELIGKQNCAERQTLFDDESNGSCEIAADFESEVEKLRLQFNLEKNAALLAQERRIAADRGQIIFKSIKKQILTCIAESSKIAHNKALALDEKLQQLDPVKLENQLQNDLCKFEIPLYEKIQKQLEKYVSTASYSAAGATRDEIVKLTKEKPMDREAQVAKIRANIPEWIIKPAKDQYLSDHAIASELLEF